jgi:hypothetical protein
MSALVATKTIIHLDKSFYIYKRKSNPADAELLTENLTIENDLLVLELIKVLPGISGVIN